MENLMDINLLRAASTLLLFIAFLSICIVVFSRKRKDYYEQAGMLPFAEDKIEQGSDPDPAANKETPA